MLDMLSMYHVVLFGLEKALQLFKNSVYTSTQLFNLHRNWDENKILYPSFVFSDKVKEQIKS